MELNPEKVYVDTQVTTLLSISGMIGGASNGKNKNKIILILSLVRSHLKNTWKKMKKSYDMNFGSERDVI